MACSYDINGCDARAVVSAIARAPTSVAAPSRFGPSLSTRTTWPRFSIIAVVVAAMLHDDARCPGRGFRAQPRAFALPQWGCRAEGSWPSWQRGFFFLRARARMPREWSPYQMKGKRDIFFPPLSMPPMAQSKNQLPLRDCRGCASQTMEQVVIAPPEIVAAIDGDSGDLVLIEAWVAAGGDPNAKRDCSHEQRFVDRGRWQQPLPHGSRYETLLHTAAYFKRPDICEFLLSRGARVDAMDAGTGRSTARSTARVLRTA